MPSQELSDMLRSLLSVSIGLLVTCCSFAHGDLHERIQLLTADICKFPQDVELYYQRGILFLEHENYRAAVKDFRHCQKRGQLEARYAFGLARAHYFIGNYQTCIRQLTRYRTIQTPDCKVFRLLSQAYEMRGRYDDELFWAQKNLDEAVFLRPDHYLALARIYRLQNLKNLAG